MQNFDLNHTEFNSKQIIIDNRESNSINDDFKKIPESPKTADTSTNVIQIISKNDTLIRKDKLDQAVKFYFNDTKNNKPITNLTNNDIIVKDNQTTSGDFKIRTGGNGDHNWTLYYITGKPGYYKLNISTKGLNSGWIKLEINAWTFNNWSVEYVDFYLKGNLTKLKIIEIYNPAGDFFQEIFFIGSNLTLNFYMVDLDFNNLPVLDTYSYWIKTIINFTRFHKAWLLVDYVNDLDKDDNGTLTNILMYNNKFKVYRSFIETCILSKPGTYKISLRVYLTNYEIQKYTFRLSIVRKYLTYLKILNRSKIVFAREMIRIKISAQYKIGEKFFNLSCGIINLTVYFNNKNYKRSLSGETNDQGVVRIEFIIPINTKNLIFDVEILEDYYHKETFLKNSKLEIISFTGFILLTILITGAVVGAIIYAFIVYRDELLIKQKRNDNLIELENIFDNLVKIKKILIVHKKTGMCIFFKSSLFKESNFKQNIDFVSFVFSFGKNMKYQEILNEIPYKDKILLLVDGKFLRIAFELSEKSSNYLQKKILEFLNKFEISYANELIDWNGKLKMFGNIERLLNDILNISIILPHEINQDFSSLKDLKNRFSKEILQIARKLEKYPEEKFSFIASLIKDIKNNNANYDIESVMNIKDRNFFFISTLLIETFKKNGKNITEIFAGINELREKKVLMPMDMCTIKIQPVAQQELDSLTQKVSKLLNLSISEAQELLG